MTSSRHNLRSPFFAEFPWSKFSLLRHLKRESSKRDGKISVIATSPGTRTFVNLIRRPLVVTMTRPQANICLWKISVTSLKSQVRDSKV
jgi:hypothetical protein